VARAVGRTDGRRRGVEEFLSSRRPVCACRASFTGRLGRRPTPNAGFSNCYVPAELQQLYRSARVKPSVLQNRFYADTAYDREVRAFCRQQHIVYQSFWTLTANPRVLAQAGIAALASAHRRTPAQILFRYLTQAGVVPLIGTRSEAHMREDLSIFDFELTAQERGAVDEVLAI
jgi:diketogulonate reductase-like aldo/keto reductase